jgi:hypothetical protein
MRLRDRFIPEQAFEPAYDTLFKFMKTGIILLAVSGWLGLASCSMAQTNDKNKLRNDPTYSTQNYKHANKAATARRWESGAGVSVTPPAVTGNQVANYKSQRPNQAPVGGVTVGHTPDNNVANRNYKQQRPNQPAAQSAEEMAKRKAAPQPGISPTDVGE